jgi:uncharacterized membrane protein YphA (DoxX/SURF4 family)
VGLVFLAAAYGKIQDPARFADEIRGYQMVPVIATNAMAYILPWTELFVALLLLAGVWRVEARVLVFAMLVVFTAAKLIAAAQGLKIDCGCFSGSIAAWTKWLNGWPGIVLNFVLLGLVALDWVGARKGQARPARDAPPA